MIKVSAQEVTLIQREDSYSQQRLEVRVLTEYMGQSCANTGAHGCIVDSAQMRMVSYPVPLIYFYTVVFMKKFNTNHVCDRILPKQ